ncbi:hypothetical protein GCM10023074_27430 [Microbispora amethystogenes]|uniref:SnoaL-like domain-containing protein n=1 Tax=Microbispora amethystogenes TaxID=1427754 RepID=A0ABQ4F9M5_9ACTN|nr:hypothetical protein Mam01_16900 [Microbispora amethystogenes]
MRALTRARALDPHGSDMTTTTDRQELFHAMLTRLPGELSFGEEDPGRILDRYYTPDIEHHNDGIPLDRERLIAHARPARKNVLAVRVEVREVLVAGDRAAARFTLAASSTVPAVTVARSLLLFAVAALAEIGGAWLVWQGVREHRGLLWVGAGFVALGSSPPTGRFRRGLAGMGHRGGRLPPRPMGPDRGGRLPAGCPRHHVRTARLGVLGAEPSAT